MTHQLGTLPKPIRAQSFIQEKGVIIISGPTAAGKSSLAIELAKKIGGEIVSADSMQVYRGMNIGTAKVSQKEMEGILHHIVDICDVKDSFTVVDYYEAATAAIREILKRGKVPIVVGGTGFYVHTLIYGPPAGPPSNAGVRKLIEDDLQKLGPQVMYDRLSAKDHEYAKTITAGDRQKIVRALEIIELTQQKVSDFPKFRSTERQSEFTFRCFFLFYPREILYERIESRCDQMIEMGFPEEVERLDKNGLRGNLSASQAIGYRQYLEYLDSEQTEADWQHFVWAFKQSSRRYAKRQFTWFRKEPLFTWIDLDLYEPHEVLKIILG
ncbi:MAG: tRNA dimethylallyltransferase [Chlamydiia bacterium]|nr:tRNA dimethylallyltransferase [Chlamydiia bacterium]MCH9615193.1 tRNA dimethylallyltransferase [Chlamydiia bacterium]MCH9628485.1 tRNA dimethylallyltransferase [Chlamydiia bacterium]